MTEIDSYNQSKQTPSGGTCRAWMLFDDTSRIIFLFESNNNLAEIYSKCTSLTTDTDDGLPKHICLNCHNDLVNYNKFRLLCTASDSYFRQNEKVKTDHSCNEELLIEEDESMENDVDERLESDSEVCVVNEESKDLLCTDNSEENAPAEICNPNSTEQLDVDDKSAGEMGNDDLEAKSKKSTLSCDQCGKKFFKLHRLEGHLRQHQGLKVCSLTQRAYGSRAKYTAIGRYYAFSHACGPEKR